MSHTPAQCRLAMRQRDALLSAMEDIVVAGELGTHDKDDHYAEIDVAEIRKAKRLCLRVRTAIASQGKK